MGYSPLSQSRTPCIDWPGSFWRRESIWGTHGSRLCACTAPYLPDRQTDACPTAHPHALCSPNPRVGRAAGGQPQPCRTGGSTSSRRAGRTSALQAPGCSPAPSICSFTAVCSLCRGLRPGCSLPSAGQEPLPGAHWHRAESCLHPDGGASSW